MKYLTAIMFDALLCTLKKYFMKTYNTYKYQLELLPRITIVYGKGCEDDNFEITKNGVALEWLWFGVFFYWA